jgi:hypothetical protein
LADPLLTPLKLEKGFKVDKEVPARALSVMGDRPFSVAAESREDDVRDPGVPLRWVLELGGCESEARLI